MICSSFTVHSGVENLKKFSPLLYNKLWFLIWSVEHELNTKRLKCLYLEEINFDCFYDLNEKVKRYMTVSYGNRSRSQAFLRIRVLFILITRTKATTYKCRKYTPKTNNETSYLDALFSIFQSLINIMQNMILKSDHADWHNVSF